MNVFEISGPLVHIDRCIDHEIVRCEGRPEWEVHGLDLSPSGGVGASTAATHSRNGRRLVLSVRVRMLGCERTCVYVKRSRAESRGRGVGLCAQKRIAHEASSVTIELCKRVVRAVVRRVVNRLAPAAI